MYILCIYIFVCLKKRFAYVEIMYYLCTMKFKFYVILFQVFVIALVLLLVNILLFPV